MSLFQRVNRIWPWLVLIPVLACPGYSWLTGGIVSQLFGAADSAADKLELLKQWIQSYGLLAPVIYVVFVIVEVVIAPIPGLMLYAPGGLLFGTLWGGFLSTLGNAAGAGIACALARRLAAWFESTQQGNFLRTPQAQKLRVGLTEQGPKLIFALRLNPLTSSDLVSYAAGLAGVRTWHVVVATGLGMAPLCFLQSWLSDSVFHALPQLFYPFLIAATVYMVVVVRILKRLLVQLSLQEDYPQELS
ncbi:MAG: VTT domain-containing protein [Planctomycetaceae bacterium]